MSIYLNDWSSKEDLIRDFELDSSALDSINIVLASYGYENYSGDAFVLFEKDGKLFEVHGSHCSCYGLEGQWDVEETSLEGLKHRIEKGTLGDDRWTGNVYRKELIEALRKDFNLELEVEED